MPTVDNGCRFGHHFRWWASDFSSIRVAVEINYLRCYFIELNKTPQQRPQPTPADGRPRIRHQIGVILWINAIGWANGTYVVCGGGGSVFDGIPVLFLQ